MWKNLYGKKINNLERYLFWGILLLAILLRCVGFGTIPAGINQDEAMAGVDAWALSQYGTDRYGIRYPVHFTAWKYGQMSVLLSYCMIPFIKLLGFHIVSVRMPMLIASCGSVVLVYLVGKKLFSVKLALVMMALTAVNPWHFMQSRWSLDCNLFPHVFLLAFYLLLLGLDKRRYLYLSMIFFGLTFYCYGVAVYSVTPFLIVFMLWCLWKKRIPWYIIFLCALIFGVIALPEIMVMLINKHPWRFNKQSIETPLFTMSYFPESIRSNDILFLNFSLKQFGRNLASMFRQCFLQLPDWRFNAIPAFGPLYHISLPFMVTGIVSYTRALFAEKDVAKKTVMLALWGYLITGIWIGAVTFEVNINRINLIWFPLIIFCGYGMKKAVDWCVKHGRDRRRVTGILAGYYAFLAGLFMLTYFTWFREDIKEYYNDGFLKAVERADQMEEYDRLYITGTIGQQFSIPSAEILTQFQCKLDAEYYQGKTNRVEGRELLPYLERYHFVYSEYVTEMEDGLYVLHSSDLLDFQCEFSVVEKVGDYVLAIKAE